MSAPYHPHTGVVALRPWPFGPPLRGRAPHHDAGMERGPSSPCAASRAAPPASAPVGGLASPPLSGSDQ